MEKATPREKALAAVVGVALADGIADKSLRAIAEAAGTSHRMLIHHFGSREKLLVEVIRAVEARQRAALGDVALDPGEEPAEPAMRFWERLRSPELAPQERLFFEVYGQALQGRQWALPLLDGIVETWVGPVAAMLEADAGVSHETARVIARLEVAVGRGLLLDVLATGDDQEVDAAMRYFQEMLAARLMGPAPVADAGQRRLVLFRAGRRKQLGLVVGCERLRLGDEGRLRLGVEPRRRLRPGVDGLADQGEELLLP
jgi:AcrR family transcriptional regulator